ncbi:class I SAM-dependent methyltransferase [Salegentibacter sp. JZCK2]|uniref:class I SAM-dependent methyltransferase n=1 Tax=Salegentibacter tibetensis TaxID=2873600 RepID=UPI001CCAA42F|nr:class I SAM-dependent methyltransferase [Salegentibacter tibetensis]MBZ9729744.1 class I SAM-dependent methyltransferase [Salegentibacter tibetensis]
MRLIKKILIKTKLKEPFKKLLGIKKSPDGFAGSKIYWENRYLSNRDSGPGSYGRLADFKAEVLNDFVIKNNIKSIIEFGCGDGNQLSLANYPKYIGTDVSKTAIELCKSKFKTDTSKSFYLLKDFNGEKIKAELVLSLDVLFHLIEDSVFEIYMEDLFNTSTNYVIIYSSNYEGNIAPHVKCRKFTDWVDKFQMNNWELKQTIKNKYPFNSDDPNQTSMCDFYIFKRKLT